MLDWELDWKTIVFFFGAAIVANLFLLALGTLIVKIIWGLF